MRVLVPNRPPLATTIRLKRRRIVRLRPSMLCCEKYESIQWFNACGWRRRIAFRDWCGETTSFPREIAEAALAHVAGDATERAYRRGDALEKRRTLMEAWAGFCEPKAGSNVLSMTRPQASQLRIAG
jgi:hypothetical protein